MLKMTGNAAVFSSKYAFWDVCITANSGKKK